MWKRNPEMPDAECNLDYLLDEVVIAGDPAEVTRRVVELREAIGGFGTLVLVAHDWDNRARWLKSLELFSREVVPAIDRSLGPGA
jgi:alkanesulfonate monooxygenase SsuD/methylene tetrahydromethanopterin reductase-like flavin-dependent oxidoreductase (luciferase family)